MMDVVLEEATIREILAETEEALAQYVAVRGVVVFDSPAHIVTGTR